MEVKITHNGGNLKSWLCSHFQITTNADSQFFILRAIRWHGLLTIKLN